MILRSIPPAQRLLHRRGGSHLVRLFGGSFFSRSALGSFFHHSLTKGYALAEPADPPLHFHTQNAGTFTPKNRGRALGPSPSVALVAHWGTPSPTPRSSCGGMGSRAAPGEPQGSAPP